MKKKIITLLMILLMCMQSANAFGIMNYRKENNSKTVVLMYHRLSENPEDWSNYCTSPKEFEEDIKYLKNQGYKFLTVSELKNHVPADNSKTVVLTFDDGYASDYFYALPILKKYNVKATFFIVGMLVGSPYYMDETMLKFFAQSPHVEIGNHSYDLHKYSYDELKKVYLQQPEIVIKDFAKNADYVKKVTGKYPAVLSYPNGLYSNYVDQTLKKSVTTYTLSTESYKFVPGNLNPTGRLNRAHTENAKMLSQLELVN